MTPEQMEHAIRSCELAIDNNALVDRIIGHGATNQANRDIELVGLDLEASRWVYEAVINTLRTKLG